MANENPFEGVQNLAGQLREKANGILAPVPVYANKIVNKAADLLGLGSTDRVFHPPMQYPLDLDTVPRPRIVFQCTPYDSAYSIDSVTLPIPQGLSFADGAAFDTIDLGTIAGISEIVSAGLDQALQGEFKKAAVASAKKAFAQATSGGAIGASILAARRLPGADGIAKSLSFAGKQIVNPRTNTAFSGNTLRSFSFDFTLIARNEKESNVIKNIHDVFRNNMYASELGGEKVMLQYPGTWTIKFVDSNNEELDYIPKIYRCNLTSCTTVINGNSNAYHADMAPHEVQVQLGFQEVKILTRNEIEALQRDSIREDPDEQKYSEQIREVAATAGRLLKKVANVQQGETGYLERNSYNDAGGETYTIDQMRQFVEAPETGINLRGEGRAEARAEAENNNTNVTGGINRLIGSGSLGTGPKN